MSGSYITDTKGQAVYVFANDRRCTGQCLNVWPAVPSGTSLSSNSGTVGSTTQNGVSQATVNGHPLYYYILDKEPGSIKGQCYQSCGAPWYLLDNSGEVQSNCQLFGNSKQCGY